MLPSGNLLQFAIEHGPVEIVDLLYHTIPYTYNKWWFTREIYVIVDVGYTYNKWWYTYNKYNSWFM